LLSCIAKQRRTHVKRRFGLPRHGCSWASRAFRGKATASHHAFRGKSKTKT
jgi:hypothetical protein